MPLDQKGIFKTGTNEGRNVARIKIADLFETMHMFVFVSNISLNSLIFSILGYRFWTLQTMNVIGRKNCNSLNTVIFSLSK